MPLRLALMGTGHFAVPAFRALCESAHQIVGVVTQPDRTGAGHHHHESPIKNLAQGVLVLQPENVNAPESLQRIAALNADLIVVAAYGQILSADLLRIPRAGVINLHGSLLPRHRGAAPVQYAVWKGDAETGVTIFQIEPKLDAGPIWGVVRTPIGPKETSGELHDRLAELAAPLTLEVLQQFEEGRLNPQTQQPGEVTRAPKIRKEQGQIDWSLTAEEIDRHVRAMQPWPMPSTLLHRPGRAAQRLLILDVDPAPGDLGVTPGSVVAAGPEGLLVACGGGQVRINVLQPSGKRRMAAIEYVRGASLEGARFGAE